MLPRQFQEHFLANIGSLANFLSFFEYDSDSYFFIKDREGKFIWMNSSLLAFLHISNPDDCVGKNDSDYFTSAMTFRYLEEDRKVMQTREPILNQPWIVENKRKERRWYLSSKFPIEGKDGSIVGVSGIMRDYLKENETYKPLFEMQEVVQYIFEHFMEKISVRNLASLMYLSVSQFERRFFQNFKRTPREFILRVRLDNAMRFLAESDLSITQIAINTGFYDSSFFTRQFKKATGLKPLEFRKRYAVDLE
ncbi:MAG: AraC family transcriptional regulator [Planctomycetaceae bacterium]|jgi:AraC-like DNA-binding protein|nr:AraC family transcriptional regulator [Planctomycetaceae bacterium]